MNARQGETMQGEGRNSEVKRNENHHKVVQTFVIAGLRLRLSLQGPVHTTHLKNVTLCRSRSIQPYSPSRLGNQNPTKPLCVTELWLSCYSELRLVNVPVAPARHVALILQLIAFQRVSRSTIIIAK
jgi:hypothetical protein